MAKINKQATADGRLVDDYDPPLPAAAEGEAVIRAGFAARDWKIEELKLFDPQRRIDFKVARGDNSYTLHAFIFPVRYSSRGIEEEKRIQLTRDYAEHEKEFSLPLSGSERCLLLGTYARDGKTVVCAWDAGAYKNHPNPNSCYVRAPAIANAMRNGFGQSIDGKGRLVCCFQPDLLPYYVENMHVLHERVVVDQALIQASLDGEPKSPVSLDIAVDVPENPIAQPLSRNRILYGAPGTGKSFRLNAQVSEFFNSEKLYERVTFHPDYTYGQFVGTYRPIPRYRESAAPMLAADKLTEVESLEPVIDYVFVPGPFLRLLVKALKNPKHNFALVIEELNRANAPAVFGEVFQLLDRDSAGEGTFAVCMPTEAQDYLRSNGLDPSVRLPANLYLWATMNSADQGVMPLDAAFKRRWTFEYVPLDQDQDKTADWQIHLNFLSGNVLWNNFRATVNSHLRTRGVPEDRLIGPFFMRKDELESGQAFKNKLLLYLRDDVVRHNPENLFRGNAPSYGALVDAYDRGEEIFAEGVDFGAVISAS